MVGHDLENEEKNTSIDEKDVDESDPDSNSDQEFTFNLELTEELKADLKSTIKEIVFSLVIFSIILGILWGYTGLWPPVVVVESNSMMHGIDSSIGAMDTGDMVLSKSVSKTEMIKTYIDGQKSGYRTYNGFGDVITFKKNGGADTPIIHRAIAWIEYNETGRNDLQISQFSGSYDVPSLNLFNITEFTIEDFDIYPYNLTVDLKPILENFFFENIKPHSGFITKGDNNKNIDQNTSNFVRPVKMEWVLGKAEGEIPWLGLIKLYFAGQTKNQGSEPPKTSFNMLVLTITLIIIILITVHYFYIHRERRKRRKLEQTVDLKAEMFQKLIMEKRDSRNRGEDNLLTRKELDTFSEDDLIRYLDNIMGVGEYEEEKSSQPITIYDLKRIAEKSKTTGFKQRLKEKLHETSIQESRPISKPLEPTKTSEPIPISDELLEQITKDDMRDILNMFLEIEVNNEIFGPEVSKIPIAKPIKGTSPISDKQSAPMAKQVSYDKNYKAPLAKQVKKPVAKPIAKPVMHTDVKKETAPTAQPVNNKLLNELMDMLNE